MSIIPFTEKKSEKIIGICSFRIHYSRKRIRGPGSTWKWSGSETLLLIGREVWNMFPYYDDCNIYLFIHLKPPMQFILPRRKPCLRFYTHCSGFFGYLNLEKLLTRASFSNYLDMKKEQKKISLPRFLYQPTL